MSDLDLATVEGVLVYLLDTPFASDAVTPLTGGFGNYAFRVHLRTPYDGRRTVVLKHAKAYVPGLRTLALSLDRQIYEVAALERVKELLPPDSLLSVPEVLRFDEDANAIIMSDCGEGIYTLKQLLQSHTPSAKIAREIGEALGVFIGRLHSRGASDRDFLDTFQGNVDGRKTSAFVTYGRLVSTFTTDQLPMLSDPPFELPEGRLEAISAVATKTINGMLTTDETVVMGDFWPGNVLVSLRRDDGDEAAVERIYVVDWEMTKPGLAGLDVGQFCAELLLICRFNPWGEDAASAVMASFLQAYRGVYPVDLLGAKTALVHIGAHLIAWTPRIPWGTKEKIREVVQEGVAYLVDGAQLDEDYIRESVVGALL
ncbi:predicted protein [Sparassis crispa]|uniref:Aminoglycoside phosphotransferase domain-containing protein n=1 Tax=Sparassis crispa TaxID=139825 RepID=A0A401G673_9APHY|nr:predicted protein [Sparassis crispa]GBE77663.1 predicted protein [Sparassis crispa]